MISSSVLLAAGAGIVFALHAARSRCSNSHTDASVKTADGVTLPLEITGPSDAPVRLIVGHGLGSSDPSIKDHTDDSSREVLEPILEEVGCRAVWYTARGHGQTTGWESFSWSQFSWENLAKDMLCVAEQLSITRFVAAGNSMGAATALCAALENPDRVQALILYRVPTIWETRQARQQALLRSAETLKAKHPEGWPYYATIRGAAETNLPPKSDPRWASLRKIPILILCHEQDKVHPVSSGVALTELLPHARLEVSSSQDASRQDFPPIVTKWLQNVLMQEIHT